MGRILGIIVLAMLMATLSWAQPRYNWTQIQAAPGQGYLVNSQGINGSWEDSLRFYGGFFRITGGLQVSNISALSGDSMLVWRGNQVYRRSASGLVASSLSALNGVYGTGQANRTAYWTTDSTLSYRNYLAGASRIITVDQGGNGDYTTISEGITAAAALTPSSSAPVLVLVYPGVYTEGVTVTTSYTSIVAYTPGSAVVQNGNATVLTVNSGLTNVNVSGLRIIQQTSNNNATLVSLAGGTTFERNSVECTNCFYTINISNASCIVRGNYFSSSGASSGRGAVTCSAAALFSNNSINSTGSGSSFSLVSAGNFNNNDIISGTTGTITGGTWKNMIFNTFAAAGGTYHGCTFYATGNNQAALTVTAASEFYSCFALQTFNGSSSTGYALRITTAGITVNFYGGVIGHADIVPNGANINYSIANTSGGAATLNLRGTVVHGLVDFTNLSVTGLYNFHQDAATSPYNFTLRANRFTSISNNAPAYLVDFSASTDAVRLPNGSDAQRPTGNNYLLRGSTTSVGLELYSNSAWSKIPESSFNRGTSGNVPYLGTDGRLAQANNFGWDNTNNELYVAGEIGVNNTAPLYPIDVTATSGIKIPIGTIPQAQSSLSAGVVRINSTDKTFQFSATGEERVELYDADFLENKTIVYRDTVIRGYYIDFPWNDSDTLDRFVNTGSSIVNENWWSADPLTRNVGGRSSSTNSPDWLNVVLDKDKIRVLDLAAYRAAGSANIQTAYYLGDYTNGTNTPPAGTSYYGWTSNSGVINYYYNGVLTDVTTVVNTALNRVSTVDSVVLGIKFNNTLDSVIFYAYDRLDSTDYYEVARLPKLSTHLFYDVYLTNGVNNRRMNFQRFRRFYRNVDIRVNNLNSLTDVEITAPSSSQVLAYDGNKWVNTTPSPGFTGLNIAATSGSPQAIADGETFTIAAGAGLTTTAAATRTVTVAADTASVLASRAWVLAHGWLDGTGAATQIPYFSDANTLTSEAAFTYDGTTNKLLIGTMAGAFAMIQDTALFITDAAVQSYLDFNPGKFEAFVDYTDGIQLTPGNFNVSNSVKSIFFTTGGFSVQDNTPDYSADFGSNTDGLEFPKGTTAQRPTGADFVTRGNTDSTALEYYQSGWHTIASRAWVLANAGGTTYTFTNGLTESPAGTAKLGGTLTASTSLATGAYTFTISTATSGITPLALTSTTGTTATFDATSGGAIVASVTGANPAIKAAAHTTATNSISGTLAIQHTTTGTAAAGLGGSLDYYVQTSAGALPNVARIIASLTTATGGSHASEMEFWVSNSGSLVQRGQIDATGDWTFNAYDDTKKDSASHVLAFHETTGKIVAKAFAQANYAVDGDLTLAAADVYKQTEYRIYLEVTSGASSHSELTIPAVTAAMLPAKIFVTCKDDAGSYSCLVNSGAADIIDPATGMDASTYTITAYKTICVVPIKTGASSYRWAIIE